MASDKKKKMSRRKRKRQIFVVMQTAVIVLAAGLIGTTIYMVNRPSGEDGNTIQEEVAQTPTPTPTATPTPTPTPIPITISTEGMYSSNAYLVRISDGEVLLNQGGQNQIYPASMTKIMTAIVAIENLPDLNVQITLSPEMFDSLYAQHSSMAGLSPGETLPAIDLLYGVMLPSGGEACIGIAEYLAGSEAAFVELMNQKAAELGLTNTHFVTCTGLHDVNHYTTCEDIEKLLQYALENDTFRQIITSSVYTTSSTAEHPDGVTFYSSLYSKTGDLTLTTGTVEGGKTGFTDEAGLCLASVAEIGEEEYILVTSGAPGNGYTEPYNVIDAYMIYNQIAAAVQGSQTADQNVQEGTETQQTDGSEANTAAADFTEQYGWAV